jgi:GntR family transcriptional regulator / MocR family aminotransferase
LLAALDAELPDLAVQGVAAGMHVLLRLPAGVDDRLVAAEAQRDGVRAIPLSVYQLHLSDQGGLVVGYGRIRADALEAAITTLARALRRAARLQRRQHSRVIG